MWVVYIILCSDDSLYTGISTDVERRFLQHQSGKGAKYFRSRQPSRIVFVESGHCRASATRRELAIKKLNRADKVRLIAGFKM
ncbi:MAG: GIY-YIG nuclease family protein [Methylomonas sp.]|nr:GIY-YIG nuclease family protein [Methylomonas sp.]